MKLISFLMSPKGRLRRFTFAYAWCLVLLFISMASVFFKNVNLLWFAPVFLWMPTVRRLHDLSLSGIYALIVYQVYGLLALNMLGLDTVSFMGYIVSMSSLIYFMLWPSFLCVFYLMIKKGHEGTNEYGIDPLWKLAPRVELQEFLSWAKDGK